LKNPPKCWILPNQILEEFMSASLLPASANETALPTVVGDTGSTIIVQFVRALAVRQARLDASHAFKTANDNDRGTVH
jgi:hypothetical protein